MQLAIDPGVGDRKSVRLALKLLLQATLVGALLYRSYRPAEE